MVRIIVVVLVAALGWGIYWAIAATSVERTIDNTIKSARAEGWQIELAEYDVAGFPNRIDTRFENLAVAPPARLPRWQMPQLSVFALSYRPNEVIAVWPEAHGISAPGQDIDIRHQDMRASAKVQISGDMALESATLVAKQPQLRSSLGWQATAREARIATLQMPESREKHRIGGEITDLAFSGAPDIQRIWLDATLGFNAPPSLANLQGPLAVTAAEDVKFELLWGRARLEGTGDITFSESGVANGALTVSIKGWADLLEHLARIGALNTSQIPQITGMLDAMAAGEETLQLPLNLRSGTVFLGPIPVFTLP